MFVLCSIIRLIIRLFWSPSKDRITKGEITNQMVAFSEAGLHFVSIHISLSGKIKKFYFHPGNLSMAVYTYEKPPKKVSGFVGHPVTRAINY